MSYRENDIIHETKDFWVLRLPKDKGFELYRTGTTHSTRCGRYGHGFEQRAIDDCTRRQAELDCTSRNGG